MYVYGCNFGILWSPLRNRVPQNFMNSYLKIEIAGFSNRVCTNMQICMPCLISHHGDHYSSVGQKKAIICSDSLKVLKFKFHSDSIFLFFKLQYNMACFFNFPIILHLEADNFHFKTFYHLVFSLTFLPSTSTKICQSPIMYTLRCCMKPIIFKQGMTLLILHVHYFR